MVEKKTAKKTKKKTAKKTKPKGPAKTKNKGKKSKKDTQPTDDPAIVIFEDDFEVDKEKINEERKAYLEEARSQEAYD